MSDTPITDAAYDAVRAFTNEEQAVDALIELRETSRKLERGNAALRTLLLRIRTERDLLKTRPGGQDQYAGMPPAYRLIDAALASKEAQP